jgi:hypothetical protein
MNSPHAARSLARLCVFGVIGAAMLLYWSYEEAVYQLWSRTTNANVIDVRHVREVRPSARRRRTADIPRVIYAFQDDDGTPRKEWCSVSARDSFAPGDTASIEFVPGWPAWSRIAGTGRVWPLVVTGSAVAALAAWLMYLSWEVKRYGAAR